MLFFQPFELLCCLVSCVSGVFGKFVSCLIFFVFGASVCTVVLPCCWSDGVFVFLLFLFVGCWIVCLLFVCVFCLSWFLVCRPFWVACLLVFWLGVDVFFFFVVCWWSVSCVFFFVVLFLCVCVLAVWFVVLFVGFWVFVGVVVFSCLCDLRLLVCFCCCLLLACVSWFKVFTWFLCFSLLFGSFPDLLSGFFIKKKKISYAGVSGVMLAVGVFLSWCTTCKIQSLATRSGSLGCCGRVVVAEWFSVLSVLPFC